MKIHIVAGFLGSGKTTYINKWLPFLEGKICIIENEFGDVGIDGDLFPKSLKVEELYAGCICCSLIGELKKGIVTIAENYQPEHLIIEPSGVATLSDVLRICRSLVESYPETMALASCTTLVDVTAYEDYIESFGRFYSDQIISTSKIVLSHNETENQIKTEAIVESLKRLNSNAPIITEDWVNMPDTVFESYLSINLNNGDFEIDGDSKVLPANQVLESFSITSPKTLSREEFHDFMERLPQLAKGRMIRAKGFLHVLDEGIVQFNFTPFHKEWSVIEDAINPSVAFIGTAIERTQISSMLMQALIIS